MTDTAGGRTPTLETEWNDLTTDHQHRREDIESSIDDWPDDVTQASYVIGAIGAGKTQLLTHLFKYAYTEASKPAIYVTMGQLLDEVAEKTGYPDEIDVLSQERLHEVIETVVEEKIAAVQEVVKNGGSFHRNDYLMDSGRIQEVDEYAETLDISSAEFEEITGKHEQAILIVDEMEESYDRLGEMVAQTTGPLREVVERVESRNSSFYLIGGFGYASVHELGEAEYRRVNPVTLPIIKPQSVADVLGDEISTERRNFVWWMSRGRPGWLEIADNAYEMRPDRVQGGYDLLADIPNLAMSRVDIIALEELEEYVVDLGEDERDQTALTIFRPSPTELEEIQGLQAADLESSAPLLLSDSDLVALDDVADTFLQGAQLFDGYNEALVSDQLVRRYLVRILRGISTESDKLVFGAAHTPVFQRGNICKERMLEPLAERIHDIALEETGEEEQETIDFLYELSQHLQSTPAEELSSEFSDFFDLFTESGSIDSSSYLGPGVRTLITVFPSLITNPRLNFAGTGLSEKEQFEQIIENLQNEEQAQRRLDQLGSLLQEDPR